MNKPVAIPRSALSVAYNVLQIKILAWEDQGGDAPMLPDALAARAALRESLQSIPFEPQRDPILLPIIIS